MKIPEKTFVIGAIAIVFLTVVAYMPVLDCGFVWDDDDHLTGNETLRSREGFARIWFEPGVPMQYYPLTFTAWWAQYHLWGTSPAGYHVVNVLLHILNALLLWRLLMKLNVPAAWLAAAVFALHPVNVMSVAWITELKNVLSGAFFLGAALAYVRFCPLLTSGATESGDVADDVRRRWYWVALLLYLCALLSKTPTALLPIALFLILWWKRERLTRSDLVPLIPMVLLGAGLCAITVGVEKMRGASGAEFTLSCAERLLVAGRAFWFNLGKLVWPADLAFIYPRWQLDVASPGQWLYPAAVLVLLVSLWAARGRVGKAGCAATAYFFLSSPALVLVLVLYMTRYSFVADHWQYLGSMGAIAFIAASVSEWWNRRSFSLRSGEVVVVVALLLLTGLTYRQAGIYHNLETLWRDTLAKNPGSWMAHNNLGTVLHGQGKLDDAIMHYRLALRLNPDSTDAHNNLGLALATQNKLDEALPHFHEALRVKPDFGHAHLNLGRALRAQGKLEEATRHLGRALLLLPDKIEIHAELADVYEAQGKLDSAAREYSAAVRLRPEFPEAHLGLGAVLESLDRLDEAITEYATAASLKPGYVEAYNDLGMAFLKQGRVEQAIAQFMETARLLPDLAAGRANLGLALMRASRFDDATREFREALRLDPKLIEVRCNLAEVFLRQGRVEEAREQQRAVQPTRADLATEIEKKITAYEASRSDQKQSPR